MQLRLAFGALAVAALALTGCDSNGGTVTPNDPLNPTTGLTAAPATPTPAPTATPIPTPTPVRTATPRPTTTPTLAPAVCSAPPPDPNAASVTLTGAVQTVVVPCFATFTATATVPANSSAGASIALKASTDQNFGAVVGPYGTPLLYTSLQPSAALSFASSSATIPTVVTSSTISAPHTYTVESFVPAFGSAIQVVPGIVPVGHTVSYALNTTGGNFPAIQVIVILYQSS